MSFTIKFDGLKLIQLANPSFHQDYLSRLSTKLPITLFPDNLLILYPDHDGYMIAPNCITLFETKLEVPEFLREYGFTDAREIIKTRNICDKLFRWH